MEYVTIYLLLNNMFLVVFFCMFSRKKDEYYQNSKEIESCVNVWSQNTENTDKRGTLPSKCCTSFGTTTN